MRSESATVLSARTRLGIALTEARFARALYTVDVELRFHAAEQRGDTWREHTPAHHARHACAHFFWALVSPLIGRRHDVAEHLAHGCCRALMALEVFIAAFAKDGLRTTCARAATRKETPR